MEDLKKELIRILEKYQDSYNKIFDHSRGFTAHAKNAENFSKLFEPFADEVIAKSNEFINMYDKEGIVDQCRKTISKFRMLPN